MLRLDLKYLDSFQAEFAKFQGMLDQGDLQQAATAYQQAFVALVQGQQAIGLDQEQGVMKQMRTAIHETEQSLKESKSKYKIDRDPSIKNKLCSIS